jgi:hypothetical protein
MIELHCTYAEELLEYCTKLNIVKFPHSSALFEYTAVRTKNELLHWLTENQQTHYLLLCSVLHRTELSPDVNGKNSFCGHFTYWERPSKSLAELSLCCS